MISAFKEFVAEHERNIRKLELERNLAYWRAATGGDREDYGRLAELEFKIGKLYSDSEDFGYVSEIDGGDGLEDAVWKRVARVLYLKYRGMQIDDELLREISELSSLLEKEFNTFRPVINGKTVTDNRIREMLKKESDSEIRRQAWEEQKRVGEIIAPRMIELAEMRNEGARKAGFDNFYSMSLYLSETDETELFDLMDGLEEITREPFLSYKERLDEWICERFNIESHEVMPWHYSDPFFQNAGPVSEFDPDSLLAGCNLLSIVRDFYRSIGMPVKDILERSDLYQRIGKSPHAFCIDMDREGDVRILANVEDNSKWLGTLMHELGHAVYDVNTDGSLPYLIRKYPHYCMTEASAMFFESLTGDSSWLKAVFKDRITDKQSGEISKLACERKLVFSRWCQTMVRFEREFYRDPRRDLNALWWDMSGKYQHLRKPAGRSKPDWASKIHFVTSPVYYHNYILGELIADQLRHYMDKEFLGKGERIYGNRKISAFLKSSIYEEGNLYRWDNLLERATGESLKANYFVSCLKEK